MAIQRDHAPLRHLPNQASINARAWKWINMLQGYNLEILHIPGERNPANTLSRQDKKDALGRKTTVHDANADLVNELLVPSDADNSAIQEALMKLFNVQVRDQPETVADEGQAIRAQRSVQNQALKAKRSDTDSDQALKASVSGQISPVQPESESRVQVQFSSRPDVSVSSRNQNSQCILADSRSIINIDNSLREKNHSLLQKEILHKDILEERESIGKSERYGDKKNIKFRKNY